VRSLAATRRFSLFGAERAVTRQLWKELRQAAERTSLAEAIATEVAGYVQRLAVLAENCVDLPRAFPNLRRLVAVPRVLCNAETFDHVCRRIGQAPQLSVLRGGDALRRFFCQQIVAHLDAALISAPPTPRKPIASRNEWLLVGADTTFVWTAPLGPGPAWYGHYFLFESKSGQFGWKTRRDIARACDALQQEILAFAPPQRHEILRAARVRLGITPAGR
jgi:hypothetical protein